MKDTMLRIGIMAIAFFLSVDASAQGDVPVRETQKYTAPVIKKDDFVKGENTLKQQDRLDPEVAVGVRDEDGGNKKYDEYKIEYTIENGKRKTSSKVNGCSLTAMIDKGNAVTISVDFASYLLKLKYLTINEVVGQLEYDDDGNFVKGTVVNLNRIRLNGVLLKDIKAVVKEQDEKLIIGVKNLNSFGKVKIDDKEKVVRVKKKIPKDVRKAQLNTSKIYDVVELPPTFPGGIDKLMNYLSSNIHYPEFAEEHNIQGRVVVSFVVEPDGSIGNIETVYEAHPLLDAESMRVVSIMPRWNPGRQNGKPVRVKYNLPVTFKLQ